MPLFCEVALPVPLDRTFTYALGSAGSPRVSKSAPGAQIELSPTSAPAPRSPVVGGRVLVPFRTEKLSGIVTRLHDTPPPVEARPISAVLDTEPVLTPHLLTLADWIASYYIAPLGEVLRSMLPLMAEVRRDVLLSLTDAGRKVLYLGAEQGASRRSRIGAPDQDKEYTVLNYLETGDSATPTAVRRATGAPLALINGMIRKKWLSRETFAASRDARRLTRYAVLANDIGPETLASTGQRRLNENQQRILTALALAGGALPTPALRAQLAPALIPEGGSSLGPVPATTLNSLVNRGLVRIELRPAGFHLAADISSLGGREAHLHSLGPAQASALAQITTALGTRSFRPTLLHGVTGSGKTAVYLAAMRAALDSGRTAILLVPEIGLTPAMAAQVHAAFRDSVALLHSALTSDERSEQWRRIRRGEARAIVGTRSAVFAPVENLGLIIVDEEHDGSYKQAETPRYNARDVAVMRAKIENAVIVLGSATPSLESWSNAERGRYTLLELKERIANRPLPAVNLIDMRAEFQATGRESLFSRQLIAETQAALDRGEQAIILLNRRGYSFVVLCRACGHKLECEN